MAVEAKPDAAVVNELKTRIEELERQADALRSGLDDMALLLSWTMERSVPPALLRRVSVSDEQIAAQRQWDGHPMPLELVRLFLQAHTVATRLKGLVAREDKDAVIAAVVETFRRIAAEEQLQAPVEMEATIGD